MSEMLERVTSVIYSRICDIGVATYEDAETIARAALGEMREPTEEMTDAGLGSGQDYGPSIPLVYSADDVWKAMIDAALTGGK